MRHSVSGSGKFNEHKSLKSYSFSYMLFTESCSTNRDLDIAKCSYSGSYNAILSCYWRKPNPKTFWLFNNYQI